MPKVGFVVYDRRMTTAIEQPRLRTREEIPESYTWNLSDIYPNWDAWEAALKEFETRLSGYAELKGTLAQGAGRLVEAFTLEDDLGRLSYKLWITPASPTTRTSATTWRTRVGSVCRFSCGPKKRSWFTPELPHSSETVRGWMTVIRRWPSIGCDQRRITSRNMCSTKGEHLLSLSSRFATTPHDTHSMLSTADVKRRSRATDGR